MAQIRTAGRIPRFFFWISISAANAAGNLNSTEFNAATQVANQQNTSASYYAGMFDQYAQLAGSYYLFAS